jgi:hypothetical protein
MTNPCQNTGSEAIVTAACDGAHHARRLRAPAAAEANERDAERERDGHCRADLQPADAAARPVADGERNRRRERGATGGEAEPNRERRAQRGSRRDRPDRTAERGDAEQPRPDRGARDADEAARDLRRPPVHLHPDREAAARARGREAVVVPGV